MKPHTDFRVVSVLPMIILLELLLAPCLWAQSGPACSNPIKLKPGLAESYAQLVKTALGNDLSVNPPQFESPPSQVASATRTELPSLADVSASVKELNAAPLLDGAPLQYGQIRNDCESRAEVAAYHLLTEHPKWIVGKVFVTGTLGAARGKIPWGFHVAPYVVTKDNLVMVIDPAFDSADGILLHDWVGYTIGHDRDNHPATVDLVLRSADVWSLGPSSVEASQTFCARVEGALLRLKKNRSANKELFFKHVLVDSIDEKNLSVWFIDNNKKTGWFAIKRNFVEPLKELKNTQKRLTVGYRIVHRGFLKGKFFNVDAVTPD